MKSRATLAIGALALIALMFVARDAALHLVAGYQVQIYFEGGPYRTYEIVFPLWRQILGGGALAILAAGILLGIFGRSHAFSTLVVGIAGIAMLGLYDVWRYGTAGSPTSLWGWFLVAALSAAAVTGKRLSVLR